MMAGIKVKGCDLESLENIKIQALESDLAMLVSMAHVHDAMHHATKIRA